MAENLTLCWCTHPEIQHAHDGECSAWGCECTKFQPPDAAMAPAAPLVKLLTPQQIRMVGAMNVEAERSHANLDFIEEQKGKYQTYSKDDLIEELARRDATLLQEGRDLSDGKMAGRFLREFVRGILLAADHADIQKLDRQGREITGSKGAMVENMLRMLGADPLDNRMLRLEGSGLGTGMSSEEAEEQISSPDRIPQLTSVEAADSIRTSRAEKVAERLNSLLDSEGASRRQETGDGNDNDPNTSEK